MLTSVEDVAHDFVIIDGMRFGFAADFAVKVFQVALADFFSLDLHDILVSGDALRREGLCEIQSGRKSFSGDPVEMHQESFDMIHDHLQKIHRRLWGAKALS